MLADVDNARAKAVEPHPLGDAHGRVAKGQVAVVVATHKHCFPLTRCLAGLRDLLDDPADLVFVDNGSGGAMSDWARQAFPDVTLLTRPHNGYFCGGYNTGLSYALERDCEFGLIVNADTEVHDPRFLGELIHAAARRPRAAFLGPKVFFGQVGTVQNTVLTFPFFRRKLVDWVRDRAVTPVCSLAADRERTVDFLNGVCVLCRMRAVREIGLMDEVMGGYKEDTDWGWRARQTGWQSVYVPVPSIVHHQENVGYEHYSAKMFMLRRNTVYWHVKCGRRLEARLYAASALLLARLRWLLNRRDSRLEASYRYYVDRLADASRRLLANEPLGEWFGPPLGTWSPPSN